MINSNPNHPLLPILTEDEEGASPLLFITSGHNGKGAQYLNSDWDGMPPESIWRAPTDSSLLSAVLIIRTSRAGLYGPFRVILGGYRSLSGRDRREIGLIVLLIVSTVAMIGLTIWPWLKSSNGWISPV